MSQNDLATALGLSAAHVGHIERGSRHASLETVVAISQQLEVSLDQLIFPEADQKESNSRNDQLQRLRELLLSVGEIIDGMGTAAVD